MWNKNLYRAGIGRRLCASLLALLMAGVSGGCGASWQGEASPAGVVTGSAGLSSEESGAGGSGSEAIADEDGRCSLSGESAQAGTGSGGTGSVSDEAGVVSDEPGDGEEAPVDKEETVTVKAAPDGSVRKITVHEKLRVTGTDPVEDLSTLTDIHNFFGGETFTRRDDGTLLWENLGSDIRYEGTSDQQLPVTVSVSAELDGRKMDPVALAGKSGHLTLRFDYTNHTAARGSAVPFLALTMVPLDSEVFSNVTCQEGQLLTLDDSQVFLGVAFPSLAESLLLDSFEPTEEIELPSYACFEADVTDFTLPFTATYVGSGLLGELKEEDLDDLSDMGSDMQDLKEASQEILDGTQELYDGTKELEDAIGEYMDGVGALDEGVSALADGLSTLKQNSAGLTDGSRQLSDGLTTLKNSLSGVSFENEDTQAVMNALNALKGDAAVFETALTSLGLTEEAVKAYLSEASEAAPALQAAAESLQSALDALPKSPEELIPGLAEGLNAAARGQAEAALAAALSETALTEEEKARISKSVQGAIDVTGVLSETVSGMLAPLEGARAALQEAIDGLPQLTLTPENVDEAAVRAAAEDAATQLAVLKAHGDAIGSFGTALGEISGQIEALKSGVSALVDGSSALAQGIAAYTGGVAKVADGAGALRDGVKQLSSAGSPVKEGLRELVKGTGELHDGYAEFDEEAIKALTDTFGEEFTALIARIREVRRLDSLYENYAGIAPGKKGSVRFVIETEAVE